MLACLGRWLVVALVLLATLPSTTIRGCSRALFNKFSDKIVVSGRSMDWMFSFDDLLFVYPRGEEMDGGTTGDGVVPTKWTSKYGSVVSSIIGYAETFGYDFEKDGATDGINEAGLSGHILYLEATKFPTPNAGGKKNVTYLRWLRYILDNFATVSEAVDAMRDVNIVPVDLDGHIIPCHMAMEDATGDSAVIEIIDGSNTIYHGRDVLIMTNDPPYNEQKALLEKYISFGGDLPLPGSTSSEDRFVRLSFFLPFLRDPKDDVQAVAKVRSLMMGTNVPFDAPDGYDVNTIFPSWWNSYCDMTNLVYYFSWLETPFVLWTELKDLDFSPGGDILVLDPKDPTVHGDVSSLFIKTGDFKVKTGSGGRLNHAKVALMGSSSLSMGQNAKDANWTQSTSVTTIFAAFSVCAIGAFVYKIIIRTGSNSHYTTIPERA